jgi:hypothetical protein
VLHSIQKFALVLTAILPDLFAFSCDLTLFKVSLICFTKLDEIEFPFAMEHSFTKGTFVVAAICETKLSLPMFQILTEIAFKLVSIRQSLNTVSLHLEIAPLTIVRVTIFPLKKTVSLCAITLPLTDVRCLIRIVESSCPMPFTFEPLAYID